MQENFEEDNSEILDNQGGQFYGSEHPQVRHVYTTKQKFVMAGLVFFAFVVVVMWVIQLREGLRRPFEYSHGEPGLEQNEVFIDKTKDTDKDGLSDFDETNVYGTSPYLEDSDSDGMTDYEELMGSNDPNCPPGSDCSGELNDTLDGNASEPQVFNMLNSTNNDQGLDYGSLFEGSLSAKELRAMLYEVGADPKMIDASTDKELIQMYKEMLEGINNQ